jgi:hypothetical protein
MNRVILAVLCGLIIFLGGMTAVLLVQVKHLKATPPDKIQILTGRLSGEARLILAEERVYQEYFREFRKGPARATVLFRWMTAYQYLIDLQDRRFGIAKEGGTLKVSCPPVTLNEPVIDISTYRPGIVTEGSIWINEHKLIADEMAFFRSRSLAAGQELLRNPQMLKTCADQIRLHVLKTAAGLNIQADDVEINFAEK